MPVLRDARDSRTSMLPYLLRACYVLPATPLRAYSLSAYARCYSLPATSLRANPLLKRPPKKRYAATRPAPEPYFAWRSIRRIERRGVKPPALLVFPRHFSAASAIVVPYVFAPLPGAAYAASDGAGSTKSPRPECCSPPF
eukprot:1255417-Rhodomonas_salina.2